MEALKAMIERDLAEKETIKTLVRRVIVWLRVITVVGIMLVIALVANIDHTLTNRGFTKEAIKVTRENRQIYLDILSSMNELDSVVISNAQKDID